MIWTNKWYLNNGNNLPATIIPINLFISVINFQNRPILGRLATTHFYKWTLSSFKNLSKLAPFAGGPWNLPNKFHLYLIISGQWTHTVMDIWYIKSLALHCFGVPSWRCKHGASVKGPISAGLCSQLQDFNCY